MTPLASQIVALDAEGLTRPQIAEKLGCSRVYAWMVLKERGASIPPRGYHPRPASSKAAQSASKPVSIRKFTWEGA